jgi:predicted transposase YdaD
MSVNKEYKNSVFTTLCKDKKRLIEIYNAISKKNYPPDTEIEIATLDDVLFLNRRNDVAFVIEGRIVVLMEHQSTLCENMPVRLLIYVGRVYEKLFSIDPKLKRAIYKTKLLKIPKPEFYVLYNGRDEFPEQKELRLSDAFHETDATEWLGGLLELSVPVYNINEGFNEEIVRRSETLSGYAAFIALVRRYLSSNYTLEEAIGQAVRDCVERNILAEFFQTHASEVINMLTAEFKLEEAVEVWKEEGREEGIEKGREEGREKEREKVARNLLRKGISSHIIAESTGVSMDKIRALMLN